LLIFFLWIKRWNIQTMLEPEPAGRALVSLSTR
jgi:hypothetical protein